MENDGLFLKAQECGKAETKVDRLEMRFFMLRKAVEISLSINQVSGLCAQKTEYVSLRKSKLLPDKTMQLHSFAQKKIQKYQKLRIITKA